MKKVLLVLVLVSLSFLTGCVVPPIYGGYGGYGGAYGHPYAAGASRDAVHHRNMMFRGDNYPGKSFDRFGPGGPNARHGQSTRDALRY